MGNVRWDSLPHFTNIGHYSVHYDLFKPFVRAINTHLEEDNLILCPDFQRGHVWTTHQQIAFIEYLIKGGTSGRDVYFNCTGWMNHSWKGQREMVCVDGLQRITAIYRFYKNEIPIFGHYFFRDFDNERNYNDTYGMTIYINDLNTRAEVLNWYLEMNSGGTPHTEMELQRVRQLYEFELKSKH